MPVIPLYFHTRALAVQPWVQMGTSQAGPLHFDRWIIDLAQRP
jgi:hypothetical protein